MLKRLFVLVFIFLTQIAFAQTGGNGRINGTLLDSSNKEPIEFATLSLFKSPNLNQPVDGVMTDETGKFDFRNLSSGQYVIRFTFIGYETKSSEVIDVGEGSRANRIINLGEVQLEPTAQLLEEIAIVGQGALIEERVDRLVYNADRDVIAKGGDATEILRKVPLLSVDLDGNVELRGSSNIRVLINNKPSTIMASSVADALKQIPADQIKTVEVITSPSAKYDAEGTTGIVNIITKKNNIEGYSLGVDLGGGNRGGNLGVNGNLKAGKLGFTLGGFGRANYNPSRSEMTQVGLLPPGSDNTYVINQVSEGKNKMMFGRYTLGMDYDISTSKSISAGARYGLFSFGRNEDLHIDEYTKSFGQQILQNSSQMEVISKMPNNSWDFNLDYLHVIKPQKEFSISSLYSRSGSHSTVLRNPIADTEGFGFKNINDSKNQEITLQTDYMTPFKSNQLFEVGMKGIFRIVDSEFENIIKATNNISTPGDLAYNQNIGAAYLAYTYSTPSKYTFKLGGRYEYTDINASTMALLSGERDLLNIPAYGNFIPSVNISKTLAENYTVKLAYNQRIQRPGIWHLNPNENQANPFRISKGNPALSPEVSNNIEASLSAGINKLYFNLAVFTRLTDNAISSLTTQFNERGEGVTLTTFENVGKSHTTGVNLFGNYQLTSKWTLNGGVETFYVAYKGLAPGFDGISLDFTTQGWNLSGRLMTNLTLNKGWQIQGFGFMRGNSVIAQGSQSGWGHYALGFKKDFNNKKGSIGMNFQNFITPYMKFKSNLETFTNIQTTEDYRYNRGVNVNLSYKIGKMGQDMNMFKRRSRGVKNEDILQGGGEGQQEQGQ